jgi:phosphoribosylanthranilate isomerase
MSLRTLVKVSEVNNLSDARYCAGMGVEMVGFSLDENHPKFIELAKLREISVWISGIKVVGEFTGENIENMNYLAHELNLDYIQLNHTLNPDLLDALKKPVIQKLLYYNNEEEIENFLRIYQSKVEYFLIESDAMDSIGPLLTLMKKWCSSYPIILGIGITTEDIDNILTDINPSGIALKGGTEIKPGLKTFDELSSILEVLEIND